MNPSRSATGRAEVRTTRATKGSAAATIGASRWAMSPERRRGEKQPGGGTYNRVGWD